MKKIVILCSVLLVVFFVQQTVSFAAAGQTGKNAAKTNFAPKNKKAAAK